VTDDVQSARVPFGRPAWAKPALPTQPRRAFVLGAYPSALHIAWTPPAPFKPIKAVPVDLEPEPFWNGSDEVERVQAWMEDVGWKASWGRARPAGRLNGSSGAWVDEKVLRPLGLSRSEAWITDCLHWYCSSNGAARRIADTYQPFADDHGAPEAWLPAHPSEPEIVKTATEHELPRLREELERAAPELVVTLGNAALRVARRLLDGKSLPRKLAADASYARRHEVALAGRRLHLLPLAHPAAPRRYQEAHTVWIAGGAGGRMPRGDG